MNGGLVSLEEYLDTSYSPDREFVDGVVVERNGRERPQNKVQVNMVLGLNRLRPNLHIWPRQRVRTTPSRVRLPDICVTLDDPRAGIFEAPPFLCIEILRDGDALSDLMVKLEEYDAMGVVQIWVVDPARRKAYTYWNRELIEVTGGRLKTQRPEFSIALDEVFQGL